MTSVGDAGIIALTAADDTLPSQTMGKRPRILRKVALVIDAWRLQIEIVELRRAFESVMDHLEQASGATIEVPQDFFWSLPGDAIFEVTERPELTIGQLTESWHNLKGERDGDSQSTVDYAVVWLGDIMKGIGHTLSR